VELVSAALQARSQVLRLGEENTILGNKSVNHRCIYK